LPRQRYSKQADQSDATIVTQHGNKQQQSLCDDFCMRRQWSVLQRETNWTSTTRHARSTADSITHTHTHTHTHCTHIHA